MAARRGMGASGESQFARSTLKGPGDTFRLFNLDGVLILTPLDTLVPGMPSEIEDTHLVTVQDTLELRQVLAEITSLHLFDT